MSGKAMLRPWMGALLTILWAGAASGQSSPSSNRTVPLEALAPANVDAGRWQRLISQMKANGLSPEVTRDCLAPALEAARQGMPIDPVLTRLEEGTAKGVEGPALREAARQRLENLENASAMLRQTGYGSRNPQHDQLAKSVTLALESGLSIDTLRGVLTQARGGQSDRMRSIIEAAETMRLTGMDETTVGQIMTDFTKRNMRRTEIIRATRFAVQQHKANVEGTRIQQKLWDGAKSGGGQRGYGVNTTEAVGSGTGAGRPTDRGGSPAGSGVPSGQGGTTPAASGPGSGSGGAADQGGSPAGSGAQSGPNGSTPSQGNSSTGTEPQTGMSAPAVKEETSRRMPARPSRHLTGGD